MRSLLSGITPSDIRLDPYPHIVVPDVLDEDTHRALNESFPPFSVIGWEGSPPPGSNLRYQLSTWLIANGSELPPVWKEFVSLHASPAFFAEVVALFRDHWQAALKQALGGDLLGHPMGLLLRDGFDSARILQDARIEINTPVTAGRRRRAARTSTRRTGCSPACTTCAIPTTTRWATTWSCFAGRTGRSPTSTRTNCRRSPWRWCQMVIFPQGINALHGVGVRHPTPHTRRYVFISAEIEENWLVPPTATPMPV